MNPEVKDLIAKQQGLITFAQSEQRELTAEEQVQFDDYQRQIDDIKTKLEKPTSNDGDTQRALNMERQRVNEIASLCREFSVKDVELQRFISDGTNLEAVREYILKQEMQNRKPSSVQVVVDEKDKFRAAAVDGLQLRLGLSVEKPAPGATDLRHLSLREFAKETLRMDGVPNASRLTDDEMLRQHLNGTSTFAGIMETTARNVFEKAYTESETTYQAWTKKGTLKDFRPTKTWQTGTAGELLLVNENGELKHDAPNAHEGAERQLLTFGRQFSMSREAFINDDVGFVSEIPALYAQSARQGINKLVYQMIAQNGTIFDGKSLFHADHKNIAAVGGAPNVETISAGRRLMKNQTAPGGTVKMNIGPKFLIVPTALETAALQMIYSSADPNAVHASVQNPFYNSLQVIADAELDDATANGELEWYLAADALRSAVQVDFLNGVDMPTIQMRQAPPGQLGFVWDIYIDYGVTLVDWRTLIKNNGQ